MAVASGAEALGRLVEQRFEDRVQEAANHLLGDAIADRGNTQQAKLPPAFVQELAP